MSSRYIVTAPVYRGGRARQKTPCRFALAFEEWCGELLAVVRQDPTSAGLTLAKAELQDKYHEYRSIVGREHRDNVTANGHPCIWHVYEETYLRFREYERRFLNPDVERLQSLRHEQPEEASIDLGEVIDGEAFADDNQTGADPPGA